MNAKEIETAVKLLREHKELTIKDAALLAWPLGLGSALPDLNLGFLLNEGTDRFWLVFSLKPPFTALHAAPLRAFQNIGAPHAVFAKNFGRKINWEQFTSHFVGNKINSFTTEEGDRVVHLLISGGVTFTVELFGARPNWVLRRGDEILGSWRERPAESVLAKKPSGKIFTDRFANVADAQWFECMYQHYKTLRHEYCLKALKAEALKAANEEYHQRIDAVKDLEEAMKKAQGAEKYRRWGELLKAELSHLKSALKSKTLKLGDETITVDESLTPAENMLKFFTRAKKLERTKKETGPRLEKAQAQLQKANVALSVVKELVDSSLSFDELIEKFSHHKPVTAERVQASTQKKKTKESKSTLRRFLSKEGRTIMLGRNHKENDELVMRIARGNDLWFHVKGRPGAHVIVQLPSKAGASLETMLDAATLVAHYSGVASGEKVEVDYTLRKNVKRRPGGGASRSEQFLVNYTGAKTLVILVDEERLSRLLGGS